MQGGSYEPPCDLVLAFRLQLIFVDPSCIMKYEHHPLGPFVGYAERVQAIIYEKHPLGESVFVLNHICCLSFFTAGDITSTCGIMNPARSQAITDQKTNKQNGVTAASPDDKPAATPHRTPASTSKIPSHCIPLLPG